MYGDALVEFADAARNDLGLLVSQASARLMGELFGALASKGYPEVHLAHSAVFVGLDPEGTRISDLARRANVSRQAMSILVRDLHRAGYVTVETDPTDQRATVVTLDRRGAEFCRAAAVVSCELSARADRRLGQPDAATLRRTLTTLLEPDSGSG
ncbi:MAG: MarR family transcriptional regulator [Pseudolysinimonas sp.]|uniref:MarR family winged helix-turn-helix transcriptional regulator n=1 Tax=Pseudolysinimonas sp. TaxID=2680009 RepID=UPI003266AE2A